MLLVCIGVFTVLLLSILNVIKISEKKWLALWLAILPHSLLIILYILKSQVTKVNSNLLVSIISSSFLLFLTLFCVIKFNILPTTDKLTKDKRLNILVGGRKLLFTAIYAFTIQTIIYMIVFTNKVKLPFEMYWIIADLIINISFIVLLVLNGLWRIVILSRRLNIIKKVIYVCLMWIPVVNFFVILLLCHAVAVEYDHELYKINQNNCRVETQLCKTKYPLVMLHGVGFRDIKYLNYWGRIPKELIKNGATVYYGHQEAWGTIEANAEDVKKKILEIVNSTGVEKVNIIAHSKGGLDARYMISKLEMEDYVASLTTMSTPHRGSFIIDFAYKLPDKLVGLIGRMINRYFKIAGDKNPDFETASKQFLTENAQKFNEEVTNSDKVYYQSYATAMSHAHSDYILFVPFIIGRIAKEENDGLVSPNSAHWGEFKGVIKTQSFRGISHGDIIDLRRNDYKGFDAREFYVNLVSDLKKRGF